MDITYNEWGMGYIYLKNICNRSDSNEVNIIESNYSIETNQKLENKIKKLNWPNKLYIEAKNEDFIEEFQNDLDNNLYIKGIELKVKLNQMNNIIDSYKIETFKFNNDSFYFIAFAPDEEIFNPDNYIYSLSEKNDAFAIFNLKEKKTFKIAFFKALFFKDSSPYDINYFKSLKLY